MVHQHPQGSDRPVNVFNIALLDDQGQWIPEFTASMTSNGGEFQELEVVWNLESHAGPLGLWVEFIWNVENEFIPFDPAVAGTGQIWDLTLSSSVPPPAPSLHAVSALALFALLTLVGIRGVRKTAAANSTT
jgi:hypothetical protein